jgi:uncharacterized membrane protein YbhN (UPF0104 family)
MDDRAADSIARVDAQDRMLRANDRVLCAPNRITERAGSVRPVWRARVIAVLKAAITAVVLVVCATRVDLHAVASDIAAASPADLTLAFAAFLLIPVLGGLRWWIALRAITQPAGFGLLICLFSVATTFGQVLPSLAGDGLRAWLAMRAGYQPRRVLHSIFLERTCMLLALLALGVATQTLLTDRLGPGAPHWGAALLLLGGVIGIAILTISQFFLPWLGQRYGSHALAELSADTRRIVLSRWCAALSLTALLSNLNFVVAIGLLGHALHTQASALDFLAFVPLVTLVSILPISFGGWGVREGALVALLHTVGVSASAALAVSLMTGTFSALAGLPGLLVWALSGMRWRPAPRPDPVAAGG